jgi:hypothetical protein
MPTTLLTRFIASATALAACAHPLHVVLPVRHPTLQTSA